MPYSWSYGRTPAVRDGTRWRLAVWGLRVIGAGLAVVVIGLLGLVVSTGVGQAVLAVGMGVYLVGVVITVVGIALIYHVTPSPRPKFLDLRWSLILDAVHVRAEGANGRVRGPGFPDGIQPVPSRVEDVRRSSHWKIAVWGVRATGLGMGVVAAGLITLAASTSVGASILVVGVGIYLVGLATNLVEVRRAYGDARPPRPAYAEVQRAVVHDALRLRRGSRTAPRNGARDAIRGLSGLASTTPRDPFTRGERVTRVTPFGRSSIAEVSVRGEIAGAACETPSGQLAIVRRVASQRRGAHTANAL